MAQEKPKAKLTAVIGFWAFILALVVGIIGGIISPGNGGLILIMVILGSTVGLLNVTEKESVPLILAAIALIVVGTAGFEALDKIVRPVGSWINQILDYFSNFMAPAAVISAIRIMLQVAKPG